jgi:hypothetical protein
VEDIQFEVLDDSNEPITNQTQLKRLLSVMTVQCSWIEEKTAKKRGRNNSKILCLEDTILPPIQVRTNEMVLTNGFDALGFRFLKQSALKI